MTTATQIALAGVASLAISSNAMAQLRDDTSAEALIDIPLEQLMKMDIEVTSASKKAESASDVPAAVFVISHEDIRRSAATTIPDVLSMAPGIQSSHISATEWAVSSRGLSGRFSRYLLVLINGRSIYNSLFNGINWDEQNINLKDIERIEVIRGPGGSVWGANALNGVINIITRQASDKEPSYVSIGNGQQDKNILNVGVNNAITNNLDYRFSYHQITHAGFDNENRTFTENDWTSQRGVLALDWQTDHHTLEFNADIMSLSLYTQWPDHSLTPPYTTHTYTREDKSGSTAQVRYTSTLRKNLDINMRASYDEISTESELYISKFSNKDLEAEIFWQPNARHQLNTGISVRQSISTMSPEDHYDFAINPESTTSENYSAFTQYQYLITQEINLILGARIDDYNLSDTAIQPTARILFHPYQAHRFWLAASRAISTPSLSVSQDTEVFADIIPPNELSPIPIAIYFEGGDIEENTELDAFEAGYRYNREKFNLDISIYQHNYRGLLRVQNPSPSDAELVLSPVVHSRLVAPVNDSGSGNIHGIEVASSWQLRDYWHLQYSGCFASQNFELADSATVFSGEEVPSNLHSLRSLIDINRHWEFDVWLNYTPDGDDSNIKGGWNADLRLGWKINHHLQIEMVGKNLIADDRVEFNREAYYADSFTTPSSLFVNLQYQWD